MAFEGLHGQGYVSITKWELVTEQVPYLHVHIPLCAGEFSVPVSEACLCQSGEQKLMQDMHAPKLQSPWKKYGLSVAFLLQIVEQIVQVPMKVPYGRPV